MNSAGPDQLVAQWTRLGVAFNAPAARHSPDLERLLIQTVRLGPADARLFTLAMTWLIHYGKLVAKHRLRQFASEELSHDELAVLGLLLETVNFHARSDHFEHVITACTPAHEPQPLFDVDRAAPALARLAQRRASDISRRWNRFCEPLAPKPESLRPLRWIIQANPTLLARAVFKGGLKASILACLIDPDAPQASEAQLARRCGVTRKAMHEAIDDLEFCGMLTRSRVGREYSIGLDHEHPLAPPRPEAA